MEILNDRKPIDMNDAIMCIYLYLIATYFK